MAYSKNELGTINTLYFPKKNFILHPYLPITATSAQRPLSSFCPPARKPRTQISLCFFSLVVGDLGTRLPARWPLWKGMTVHVETKVLSSERC